MNRSAHASPRIALAWKLLYYTFIIVLIVAGIDKFFNFLTDWSIYLNPSIPHFLNISSATFLRIFGVLEIIFGLLFIIKPKQIASIVMVVLTLSSINLLSLGIHSHEGYAHAMVHYDVAVHDMALVVAAYVFILLCKELDK